MHTLGLLEANTPWSFLFAYVTTIIIAMNNQNNKSIQ